MGQARAGLPTLLVCGALLAPPATPAEAQAPGCGEAVRGWAAAAAADLGVPIDPVGCPPGMARLRLRPEGVAPLDVEVAEPPGPAFRRAGRLRVSPIVDVPDYAELPAAQRAAYEALVGWLEDHQAEALFDEGAVTPPRPGVGLGLHGAGWWLVIGALLLVVLAWVRAPPTVEWAPAGALFLVSAALRTLLGLWGPHHVNGQGPLWVRGALREPGLLSSYGPGYPELMGPLARASDAAPDLALFAANATWSSLAPPLLYGVARAAGLEPRRALFAALLLALDPISVRFGATEAYFAPLLALLCGAILAAMRATSRAAHRQWLPAVALWLAAGLLAAQAARVHPVAWIPLALVPAAAWLGDDPRTHLARAGSVLAAAGVIAASVWITSAGWIARVAGPLLEGDRGPGMRSAAGDIGFDALLLLALGSLALLIARPRAAVPLAVVHVLLALATRHVYGQSAAWQASYDRLFAPMLLVGLAALLPARVGIRPVALAAAASVAGALLVHWPSVSRPTTEQLEHRFLRAHLPTLGADCRVAHVERVDRRVLDVPDYLVPSGLPALRVRSPDDLAAATSAGCVYWLRTSLCASAEARAACEQAEAAVALEPHARAVLPARPSYDGLPHDRPLVEVGILRAHPRPR